MVLQGLGHISWLHICVVVYIDLILHFAPNGFYDYFRCGRDFVTSGLVLLNLLNLLPGRGLPSGLAAAYADFVQWCSRKGKSTNIRGFTRSAFKMG